MPISAQTWLQRLRELPLPSKTRIMNVCGGHERAISMAGLRSALPAGIELIPGPGCPVCVSDEGACRIWWSSGVREAARTQPVVSS